MKNALSRFKSSKKKWKHVLLQPKFFHYHPLRRDWEAQLNLYPSIGGRGSYLVLVSIGVSAVEVDGG